MAFNMEDHIPKGYVKETVHYDGATVTAYRNPNPDPVERQKAINDIAEILMIGRRRRLLQEQLEREEQERKKQEDEKGQS